MDTGPIGFGQPAGLCNAVFGVGLALPAARRPADRRARQNLHDKKAVTGKICKTVKMSRSTCHGHFVTKLLHGTRIAGRTKRQTRRETKLSDIDT